jgi:hypothetical protein
MPHGATKRGPSTSILRLDRPPKLRPNTRAGKQPPELFFAYIPPCSIRKLSLFPDEVTIDKTGPSRKPGKDVGSFRKASPQTFGEHEDRVCGKTIVG